MLTLNNKVEICHHAIARISEQKVHGLKSTGMCSILCDIISDYLKGQDYVSSLFGYSLHIMYLPEYMPEFYELAKKADIDTKMAYWFTKDNHDARLAYMRKLLSIYVAMQKIEIFKRVLEAIEDEKKRDVKSRGLCEYLCIFTPQHMNLTIYECVNKDITDGSPIILMSMLKHYYPELLTEARAYKDENLDWDQFWFTRFDHDSRINLINIMLNKYNDAIN